MPADARVLDLLADYEERLERGEAVTPELLCAGCPDLLPEVRRHLRALHQINQHLDLCTAPAPPAPCAERPVIPGYEVLEELGRGGMGVVYKARQCRPDRWVALKVLLPQLCGLPEKMAR